MKKYIGLTLALVMSLFLFAGCSEKDTKGTSVKESIEAVYTQENSSILNGELEYIDKIKANIFIDQDYAELNYYNDMAKALMFMTKTYFSSYGVVELKNTSGEVKSANDELKDASKKLVSALDTFKTQKADYEDTLSKYEGALLDSIVCDQMLVEYKEDYVVLLKEMATFAQKFEKAFTLGYGGLVTDPEAVVTVDEVKLASVIAQSYIAQSNFEITANSVLDLSYYTSLEPLLVVINNGQAQTTDYFKWLEAYKTYKNEKLMLDEAMKKLEENSTNEAYLNKKTFFKNYVMPTFIANTTGLLF